MANPNNVYKYMAKKPWTPVAFQVNYLTAEKARTELVAEGKKVRVTTTWLKKARKTAYSVWTVEG